MRARCAGRSLSLNVTPITWHAAPHVMVYASELSHHIAPKMVVLVVRQRPALEAT